MTTLPTRRQFLATGAALPFAMRGLASPVGTEARWVFLGTEDGKGIYRAKWNASTGSLGKIELAAEINHPTFFAVRDEHTDRPFLYSLATGDNNGAVASYRVNAATGELILLNRAGSHGDGPIFVSVDARGNNVFVANYGGENLSAFRIEKNGMLSAGNSVLNCHDNAACGTLGPVKARQNKTFLHSTTISPKSDFVLACALGNDVIEVLPIETNEKQLLGKPIKVAARAGSGPRHLAFDASGKWVYVIHEIDCTIDVYDWSVQNHQPVMTLRENSVISTLRQGTSLAGNTGCEVITGNDGRFVYACTRGVNEITVYRADHATGLLTEQQRLSCGGKVPRYMTFDPSQRWLICCNQGPAGSVTVFAHDSATGKLSETPQSFAADSPMCAQFI